MTSAASGTRRCRHAGLPRLSGSRLPACASDRAGRQAEERKHSKASNGSRPAVSSDNPVWQTIRRAPAAPHSPRELCDGAASARPAHALGTECRREAKEDAADEPILSSFLYASILSHSTFGRALVFVLANRLSDATMLATELLEVFQQVLKVRPPLGRAAVHYIGLAGRSALRAPLPPVRRPCCAWSRDGPVTHPNRGQDNEAVEQAALADVIAFAERVGRLRRSCTPHPQLSALP